MKSKKIMLLGGDGYIGFPLTMRLLNRGHVVIDIDNESRRDIVKRQSVSSSYISSRKYRQDVLSMMGHYTGLTFDIIKEPTKLAMMIKKHKPDVLINLAHNPSAPYSMISKEQANHVLTNNIIGTNNILWDLKEHSPDTHYITIGSTGEYNHTLGVDIEEGYFAFDHKGRTSKKCLFPREANSLYHASKVSSTYIIDYLTRLWGLRCTDVMQSVVYGLWTPESVNMREYTRCDTDDCFGTVVNRFIVQALLDEPLTVYGDGNHKRAFLSLNDSIQALEIAINNVPEKGVVQTWNQLSDWCSMNELAEIVKKVLPDTKISHIESPRKEYTGDHYYNYVTDTLSDFGYKPTRSIGDEIRFMSATLSIKKNEDVLRSVIQPKVIF